jgi:Fe2+ or Zn2+ uptake regulation protein
MYLMTDSTDLRGELEAAGLRVTAQRLAVLRILRAGQVHLTAEQVIEGARDRLGAVSTQAVYDALSSLCERGLARRIEPAKSAALFEARVADNHHHIVCRECGAVADVDCAVGSVPCLTAADDMGYEIDEAEVVYWGRCPACLAAGRASTGPDPTKRAQRSPRRTATREIPTR